MLNLSHNPPLALPIGGGASFCVLHVGPTEPIGTAPLSDPAVRNGSARSVRLLLKPQVGLEGWSGLRTGVGVRGPGDLWCLGKEEGVLSDGNF